MWGMGSDLTSSFSFSMRSVGRAWMKSYSEILVRVGVNIQRGQKLVFMLPHEAREFGLKVVEAAYEAGSGHVAIYYFENDIYRIIQKKATLETLKKGDSTIARQPFSFKNLLFDENAGSHIAFGTSYPDTLKNGLTMSSDELLEAGMNVSKQHIDLIIGSNKLSVVGITKDGTKVNIMADGLWTENFA